MSFIDFFSLKFFIYHITTYTSGVFLPFIFFPLVTKEKRVTYYRMSLIHESFTNNCFLRDNTSTVVQFYVPSVMTSVLREFSLELLTMSPFLCLRSQSILTQDLNLNFVLSLLFVHVRSLLSPSVVHDKTFSDHLSR